MNPAMLIETETPPRELSTRLAVPEATPLGDLDCAMAQPCGGDCYEAVSRVLNVLLALLAFTFVWPIVLAAVALVRLTSRGPAVYSQTRLGRDGRPFRIYKIRTMQHECERRSGPRWSSTGDPRVLPVGGFL